MRGIQQIFFPLANLYNKDEITEDYRQSRLKSSDTIDVPNYLHVVGETTTITLLTFPGGDGGSWGGKDCYRCKSTLLREREVLLHIQSDLRVRGGSMNHRAHLDVQLSQCYGLDRCCKSSHTNTLPEELKKMFDVFTF